MSGATVVPAPVDLDAMLAAFMARAAALTGSGVKIADADALVADVVASPLPDAVLKSIATAVGKATSFDGAAYLKTMQGARAAIAKPSGAAGAEPVTGMQNPDAVTVPDTLGALLGLMLRTIHRQVACNRHAAVATVLWVAGTYGFQGASIFPRLAITSATKRCGKSTLLATVQAMASKPLKADNVTTAALFRVIGKYKPTMLIDEVDAFFTKTDELRGVVNAGYEATGMILRSVPTPDGKSFDVAEFKVYCPVALAGIGGLPDTVLDRSVIVRMDRAPKRDPASQRQQAMRHRDLEKLRRLIAPQLVAHQSAIEAAMAAPPVVLPQELSDRAQDNWNPLVAIACLAGGTWPDQARMAAVALSGKDDDGQSHKELMLVDLRVIVDKGRAAAVQAWLAWRASGRTAMPPPVLCRFRSAALVAELLKLEHRPWPEYGKDGRGMTTARLAMMLKPFGIQPSSQRVPILTPHKLANTTTEVKQSYSVSNLRVVFRQYSS